MSRLAEARTRGGSQTIGDATEQNPVSEIKALGHDVDRITTLLLGIGQPDLDELRKLLRDPKRFEDRVREILRRSIAETDNDAVVSSISRPILNRVMQHLQNNPSEVSEALAPALGPAIRSSISRALTDFMDSMERMIERSVSPESIKWRIEAARTGRTFAEVILKHTLTYRVEHVYLIHAASGLPISHAHHSKGSAADPGAVSGMLTAITQFVQDSFGSGAGGSVEDMKVGERHVAIEPAGDVFMAAVCFGRVTGEVRGQLRSKLESIVAEHGPALKEFVTTGAELTILAPELQSCLVERQSSEQDKKTNPEGMNRRKLLVGGVALGLCLLIAYSVVSGLVAKHQWQEYVNRLDAEPGIVVTQAEWDSETPTIKGLRDPLASDPATLRDGLELPEDMRMQLLPYAALEPPFVMRRVRRSLKAPATVSIALDGRELRVSGHAPAAWIDRRLPIATAINGVATVNASSLLVTETQLERGRVGASAQ